MEDLPLAADESVQGGIGLLHGPGTAACAGDAVLGHLQQQRQARCGWEGCTSAAPHAPLEAAGCAMRRWQWRCVTRHRQLQGKGTTLHMARGC